MDELVWNNGMSVGIDSIDNEHKKLISILAKLLSAANEKLSNSVIDQIFTELEFYVIQHFKNEEQILEEVAYENIEEHKKFHQMFVNKLPQLKQEWLEKDSFETAEKISSFLHKWIVHHILEEDLDYAQAVHQQKNPAEKPKRKSLITHLSLCLSQRIKLTHRVFLTILLPLVGVLIFSLFIISTNYQRYKNTDLLLGLNRVITQINAVTYSLQAERGLSSGYVSSHYQQFITLVKESRLDTDVQIAQLQQVLASDVDASVLKNISAYLNADMSTFTELIAYRKKLDKQKVNFRQTFEFYTKTIENLLSVSENLTHIEMSSELAQNISAINAVLLYREFMGQIRAKGMDMIFQNNELIDDKSTMNYLFGQQQNAMRVFHYASNKMQLARCGDFCRSQRVKKSVENDYQQLMAISDTTARSQQWFDLMSIRIDGLNKVSELLIGDLSKEISVENQHLQLIYYAILGLFLIFLFTAILFSVVLNHSIIHPIQQVTHALDEIATGGRPVQFKRIKTKDEVSAMHLAYEKLRRKLLQADILQAMVNRQQKSLQYRKSRQEHFKHLALTDALTGAVNRHRFNEVLSNEIVQVNIYGTPLSILMLDIDHFKEVNDTFGHGAGDEALVAFCEQCKKIARSSDVIARIGGEEFVIIMPNTTLSHAINFAERLRNKIELMKVDVEGNTFKLTVSIGVAQWNQTQFSHAEAFVDYTDKLLYQAKNTGRNKVVSKEVS